MAKAAADDLLLCASSFSFLILFLLGDLSASVNADDEVAPKPAAIFIFGDSTMDVGTNNLLPASRSRADFSPNGIDFPYSVPTGRFSNGLNSADLIGMYYSIYYYTSVYNRNLQLTYLILDSSSILLIDERVFNKYFNTNPLN